MSDELVVGLDLGGTNIKARLLSASGSVRAAIDCPTEVDQGPAHVIRRLAHAAREVCEAGQACLTDVAGIGVGSPGPLNSAAGIVTRSVNLHGWRDVPLCSELNKLTGRPSSLLNDANAACFGEFWVGAGQGVDDLVVLTIGTGVGGGVISGGSLVLGYFGQAGELGHMVISPDGPTCGCGQRGCLEAYAAETHMMRRAIERGLGPEGPSRGVPGLLDAADAGSADAEEIWQECCDAVGVACVTLQHVLNPRLILLGGGVSAAGERLLHPVRAARDRMAWSMADDAPAIELALLGNDAGAIGAAGWHLEQRQRA